MCRLLYFLCAELRIFHELLSRDRETGNPLVVDAACGAGLSRAERSERE